MHALPKIHLNRYKSYLKFILTLAGDKNVNSGLITMKPQQHVRCLPYRNCNIFIDQTHFQFNIDGNNLNIGDN